MHNWNQFFDKYDYFLIDVWGVLMDGEKAYPLANEFITDLHRAKKEMVLISNTPDSGESLLNILDNMNIRTDLFKDVMTSGQAARKYVSSSSTNFGKNYLKIGHDRHDKLLDGLGFVRQDRQTDVDFILVTSFEEEFSSNEILKSFASNEIPMFCVNPDINIFRMDGEVHFCAGEIARRYEALGGEVIYVGKPFELIFELAIESFSQINLDRTIMIGDNPKTDMLGAARLGIDKALVNNPNISSQANYHFQYFTQAI